MDIWERLYEKAKAEYHPVCLSPFFEAHHVVSAIESESGEIFTGFCIEGASGVLNLCAERVAILDMYHHSGQVTVKRMIAFRDKAPRGGGSGMPCGACRELLMQLSPKNRYTEIMVDYESRSTVTLGELMPLWWGEERYRAVNLSYRPAVEADAALLVDIYNRTFRADYLRYGECPAYGRTVESMERSIQSFPKEIILCDGMPVGVISVSDKGDGEYFIGCLCVLPEYQGRGIGSDAICHLRASRPNWRRMELVTPSDKIENFSFYIKNGFEVCCTEMDGNVPVTKLFAEKSNKKALNC